MKQYKVNNRIYDSRFIYWIEADGIHHRATKSWWKLFYWLGSRNWLRYGVDRVINLFVPWKGKTFKDRWNFWGGGSVVCWWCRKYLTFD